MISEQEIKTARHGILSLLAMHAEHSEYFNGLKDLGATSIKNKLGRPTIAVPDKEKKPATKIETNPHQSPTNAISAAIEQLLGEQCIGPATLKGNFTITDKGKDELAKLEQENSVTLTVYPSVSMAR